MPVYEFKCRVCGHLQDERHSYDSIPSTTTCKGCGGMESRRQFSMPGVLIRPEGYSLSPSDPNYSKGIAEATERKVHTWQHS